MSRMEEQKNNDEIQMIGPYILGEVLGKGGYSWVKRGTVVTTRTTVALKFLLWENRKLLSEQATQVLAEIRAMIRIKSPYVLKLLDYNLDCKYSDKSGKMRQTIMLVLEYCAGGDLFDILYYTHQLDEITSRTYFVQMMLGLKACHDTGIVHRDIKPQNLLLDAHFQLKIADFGLSLIMQLCGGHLPRGRCGTRGYQAPELLKGDRYSKACDVFSCGVVLFILVAGYPPFKEARRSDIYYKPICEFKTAAFWEVHSKVKINDYCKHLIGGMLAYRASDRLSVQECLQHKWIAGKKVHTPRQLEAVVKKKHYQTMKQRIMDKEKTRYLDSSIKKRKRRTIAECSIKENAGKYSQLKSIGGNLSSISMNSYVEPPVVDNFVPNLMTFFAQKSQLNEAYNAAVNIFNVAMRGKSRTTFSPENPWSVITLVKVSDGEFEQLFEIVLNVMEIKGSGVVAFRFKRLKGDPIAFSRIWNAVFECLIKYVGTTFLYDFDNSPMTVQEKKEP